MRTTTVKAFGFTRAPFSKEVKDSELWQPQSKKEQLDAIVDAIYSRQHILIEGEPGAGKTVLLRALRHALPETRFTMTYCHNATLGKRDFYRLLCAGIGLSCRATAAAMFHALTEYVEGLAAERKQHPVFLLDEAHLLKDDMLDNLHIMQNYSWDSKALLSLVLIGLPELTERLMRRRHRSLMSRIQCRITVSPLLPDDTADYLRYRLQQAGCTKELFPPDSIALLHEKTRGLMRDIDRIASLALDFAHRKRTQIVHKDIVLDAINVDSNGGLP